MRKRPVAVDRAAFGSCLEQIAMSKYKQVTLNIRIAGVDQSGYYYCLYLYKLYVGRYVSRQMPTN
jgi:hypothetical protein